MSNDNKLRNVMMEAHSLCPTDMSHIQRMAWMADYFVQHSALPAEKPAAAAERGAVVTLDSALRALDHVSLHNGPGRRAQAANMLERLATPPAQVAEPAQVDEARCEYCDGTGDVVDQIGEWRGICICPAGAGVRKDNEIAAIVNHVTTIAKAYGQTQQCREWVSQYLVPILKGQK